MTARSTGGRRPGFAPAKINLALHILGRRPDGYHDLESLIAFADVGDRLSLLGSNADGLEVTGPFASALTGDCAAADNLAVRAAAAFRAEFGGSARAVRLEKNLPIASGIGGGSADAAAVLRLLAAETGVAPDSARLIALARALGSDVPACLDGRPCLAAGTGDAIDPLTAFPEVPIVLANAGGAVPTARVFGSWSASPGPAPGALDPRAVAAAAGGPALARTLTGTRNMLQPDAIAIAPEIDTVLAELAAADGCLLARMSGSGGTCFAMFAAPAQAAAAARRIAARNPGWWVVDTRLLGHGAAAGRG